MKQKQGPGAFDFLEEDKAKARRGMDMVCGHCNARSTVFWT